LATDYVNSRQYDAAEKFLRALLRKPAPDAWRKRQYDTLIHVLTITQKDDEAATCRREMEKL
jgi:hypothetical protein